MSTIEKGNPFRHPCIKNVLSALAVAGFGFVLLGLAFVFDFLFQSLVNLVVRQFQPIDVDMGWRWFPPFKHALFVVVIGLTSWPILRSKLPVLIKAIYITVPTAVVLATIGIFLYPSPVLPFLVGVPLVIGVLFYFYRTHQPWLYYYSIILVSLALIIFTISGGEI